MRIAIGDGDEERPIVRGADEAGGRNRQFADIADAGPFGHKFRLIGKGRVRPHMLLAHKRRRMARPPQERGQRFYSRQQRLVMDVVLEPVHAVLVRVEPAIDHRPAGTAGGYGGKAWVKRVPSPASRSMRGVRIGTP